MAFTSATPLAKQEATRELLINISKQFENYMCVLNPMLQPDLAAKCILLQASLTDLAA